MGSSLDVSEEFDWNFNLYPNRQYWNGGERQSEPDSARPACIQFVYALEEEPEPGGHMAPNNHERISCRDFCELRRVRA